MAKVVFISHAGADSPKATIVAGLLTQAEIDVRFDRQELSLGDSFLAFMESALSNADYCLLLWSCNAASTPWLRVEWEAALYRVAGKFVQKYTLSSNPFKFNRVQGNYAKFSTRCCGIP